MMKRERFEADGNTKRVVKLDGVEVQDRAVAMYASHKPDVEVEGWVELLQLDENGEPLFDENRVPQTLQVHGIVQWHAMEETHDSSGT